LYFSILKRPDGLFADLELTHVRSMPSIEDEGHDGLRTLPFTHFESSFYSGGAFFVAGTSAQSGHVLFTGMCDFAKSKKVWIHLKTI
jgi:hypothetical protein